MLIALAWNFVARKLLLYRNWSSQKKIQNHTNGQPQEYIPGPLLEERGYSLTGFPPNR